MANRFQIVAGALKAELAKPYVYGRSDCFFLGCQMVDALNPKLALVKKYAGSYSTLAGAQRALRRRKCKSLADLFARHLAPCAPAEARTGDIVIIQIGGAEHVGICLGTRFVTKTENGRSDYSLADCIAAFRLG